MINVYIHIHMYCLYQTADNMQQLDPASAHDLVLTGRNADNRTCVFPASEIAIMHLHGMLYCCVPETEEKLRFEVK